MLHILFHKLDHFTVINKNKGIIFNSQVDTAQF